MSRGNPNPSCQLSSAAALASLSRIQSSVNTFLTKTSHVYDFNGETNRAISGLIDPPPQARVVRRVVRLLCNVFVQFRRLATSINFCGTGQVKQLAAQYRSASQMQVPTEGSQSVELHFSNANDPSAGYNVPSLTSAATQETISGSHGTIRG
jgi:hypothetical protein